MMVLAIATDHPIEDLHRPVFDLNDISAIADFVEATVGPIARSGAPERVAPSEAGGLSS